VTGTTSGPRRPTRTPHEWAAYPNDSDVLGRIVLVRTGRNIAGALDMSLSAAQRRTMEQPRSAVASATPAAAVKAAGNPVPAANAMAVKAAVPKAAPT
jgi:hypothetical protein